MDIGTNIRRYKSVKKIDEICFVDVEKTAK